MARPSTPSSIGSSPSLAVNEMIFIFIMSMAGTREPVNQNAPDQPHRWRIRYRQGSSECAIDIVRFSGGSGPWSFRG
jgi:hypothetical protein